MRWAVGFMPQLRIFSARSRFDVSMV